jgi:hypothetical protein
MIWLFQLALVMVTGVLAIALLVFCSVVKTTDATRIHVQIEGHSAAADNRPLSALLMGCLTLSWQVPSRVSHSLHASLLICLEEDCNDTNSLQFASRRTCRPSSSLFTSCLVLHQW